MTTFYEQYPDIDLQTKSFGSNDEAVAKLLAGLEADVVNSCVDEATLEMVAEGPVRAARRSRLEHWDEIWPSMKELPGVSWTARPTSCPSTPAPPGSCTTPMS